MAHSCSPPQLMHKRPPRRRTRCIRIRDQRVYERGPARLAEAPLWLAEPEHENAKQHDVLEFMMANPRANRTLSLVVCRAKLAARSILAGAFGFRGALPRKLRIDRCDFHVRARSRTYEAEMKGAWRVRSFTPLTSRILLRIVLSEKGDRS